MPTIDVFEFSIAGNSRDDDSRILLAKVFLREKPVNGSDDVSQRHTGNQVRIDHSLQCRRKEGGGNSLPANVRQHDCKMILRADGIVEITADLLTLQVAP